MSFFSSLGTDLSNMESRFIASTKMLSAGLGETLQNFAPEVSLIPGVGGALAETVKTAGGVLRTASGSSLKSLGKNIGSYAKSQATLKNLADVAATAAGGAGFKNAANLATSAQTLAQAHGKVTPQLAAGLVEKNMGGISSLLGQSGIFNGQARGLLPALGGDLGSVFSKFKSSLPAGMTGTFSSLVSGAKSANSWLTKAGNVIGSSLIGSKAASQVSLTNIEKAITSASGGVSGAAKTLASDASKLGVPNLGSAVSKLSGAVHVPPQLRAMIPGAAAAAAAAPAPTAPVVIAGQSAAPTPEIVQGGSSSSSPLIIAGAVAVAGLGAVLLLRKR